MILSPHSRQDHCHYSGTEHAEPKQAQVVLGKEIHMLRLSESCAQNSCAKISHANAVVNVAEEEVQEEHQAQEELEAHLLLAQVVEDCCSKQEYLGEALLDSSDIEFLLELQGC